jgi:hypothetical protein
MIFLLFQVSIFAGVGSSFPGSATCRPAGASPLLEFSLAFGPAKFISGQCVFYRCDLCPNCFNKASTWPSRGVRAPPAHLCSA